MNYISTRGKSPAVGSAEAIRQGLAPDGGLYVPEIIPTFELDEIEALTRVPYVDRVVAVLSRFLTDYTPTELRSMADEAYSEEKFIPSPAPVLQLNRYSDRYFILELWHGPTAAFKDLALQILPRLMTAALRKTGTAKEVRILTATSGDTGKAALEGFRDVPGTSVVVFYPAKGVSDAQRLQMTTQEGKNCRVVAVEGNFDDTQAGVKAIFSDPEVADALDRSGVFLSSANSINWGRLVPQIAYYFSAYADLLAMVPKAPTEPMKCGEKINLVIPTGNFGNILAAWYAMQMGLPVNKLICASNRNKVLTDFFRTGTYDRRREFVRTNAPSMDILVSSNLERLLFEIGGHDAEKISSWMKDLEGKGSYTVDPHTFRSLSEVFVGGFADDTGTLKTIREVYDRFDTVVDTHTAVGFNVFERYAARTSDLTRTVFVSTASPLKFGASVCDALFGNGYARGRSEAVLLDELSAESGLEIPVGLAGLSERPVLHTKTIAPSGMKEEALRPL